MIDHAADAETDLYGGTGNMALEPDFFKRDEQGCAVRVAWIWPSSRQRLSAKW